MTFTLERKQHSSQSARGFSLIESLFSVVIVGLCILGITAGINFCIATIQSNRQWARSTDILLATAERLSLLRWETLVSTNFPTQFSEHLFPEWESLTNQLDYTSTTNEPSHQSASHPVQGVENSNSETNSTSQTNRLYDGNTLFLGSIELRPFLQTNRLGYNPDLRQALISLTWEHNGRLRTNSLEITLARTALNSFQEHPAKAPPSFAWTNVQSALDAWNEEQEASQ